MKKQRKSTFLRLTLLQMCGLEQLYLPLHVAANISTNRDHFAKTQFVFYPVFEVKCVVCKLFRCLLLQNLLNFVTVFTHPRRVAHIAHVDTWVADSVTSLMLIS